MQVQTLKVELYVWNICIQLYTIDLQICNSDTSELQICKSNMSLPYAEFFKTKIVETLFKSTIFAHNSPSFLVKKDWIMTCPCPFNTLCPTIQKGMHRIYVWKEELIEEHQELHENEMKTKVKEVKSLEAEADSLNRRLNDTLLKIKLISEAKVDEKANLIQN